MYIYYINTHIYIHIYDWKGKETFGRTEEAQSSSTICQQQTHTTIYVSSNYCTCVLILVRALRLPFVLFKQRTQ